MKSTRENGSPDGHRPAPGLRAPQQISTPPVAPAVTVRSKVAPSQSAPRRSEWDYRVVGAGSAGCVNANRLTARADLSVVLLEAGGPEAKPEIHDPAAFFALQGSELDWPDATEPEPGLNGRTAAWPRGKVFGGTSPIHYLLYVRGHQLDYDRWKALGNAGWSYQEVLPSFKKSENFETGASKDHGAGGPLQVGEGTAHAGCDLVVAAAKELGLAGDWDFNGAREEGGAGLYQVTITDGRRHSAAAAFLTPILTRKNLIAIPWAQATRLLGEGHRIVGVDYADRAGGCHQVRARREVIVSAGAVDLPRRLMLSGIGPAAHLQSVAVPVRADLPGLGQNLRDHRFVPVQGPACASAPLWRGGEMAGLFLRRRAPATASPDLQFHLIRSPLPNEESFWRILPTLVAPQSSGQVRLRSGDPWSPPMIQAGYLSAQHDGDVLVDGILTARELAGTRALRAHGGDEVAPGAGVRRRAQLAGFARNCSTTLWHPAGTCRMGSDARAFVDAALRVRGVSGLRVAAASVRPEIVNANTNATCLMIGEKAAEVILPES